MWSYVYHNFYDKYDWFHMGGDDLYVLVENLRLYLESDEIQLAARNNTVGIDQLSEQQQLPLYLGCRFRINNVEFNKVTFNTRGPGYTLNKAVLKALIMTFPTCRSKARACAEDVIVAQCLKEEWGINPYESKDDHGGESYMHHTPDFDLKHKLDDRDLYSHVSIDVKAGLDCCVNNSVAFHKIRRKGEMKRIHVILYGTCNKK